MIKQWISVKTGLSRDPKHRRAMGKSIWTFLHMLDLADWETGIVYGWKDENAAEDMGIDIRVLREDRRKLQEEDYIVCTQKQHGQEIKIMNWTNPREYSGEVKNKKVAPSTDEGYSQGYSQGMQKDVTPTSNSNIKVQKEVLSIQDQANAKVDAILAFEGQAQDRDAALVEFEKAMATPHNWTWYPAKSSDEPAWSALRDFVIKTYAADPLAFKKYAAWRGEKYARGAMGNLAIRRAPAEFEISYSDFLASSSMYGNQNEKLRTL